MKLKHYILLGIPFLGILFYFLVFETKWNQKSKFDIPDQQNDKIVNMLNIQIDKEIEDHTQSTMYPGYSEKSRQTTIDFLKTIKSIESYARYCVESERVRNNLELKIIFNDGNVAEKVYTGHSCSGFLDPCLLIKVELQNGKAVRVFTNGQEKKGSPDWIINDLNILIEKAISYDIDRNYEGYFPPKKTQNDFEKEWEKQE